MSNCYICGAEATTDDHMPPKGVFPSTKYLPKGFPDLRKNLITVRSCQVHNLNRSKDDEYFACFLALATDSNIALHLFKEKWIKVLTKISPKLMASFFKKSKHILLPNGQITISLNVNYNRIEKILISICKGLYYHSNNKRIEGGTWWIRSPIFLRDNLLQTEDIEVFFKIRNSMLQLNKMNYQDSEFKGENKEAFYYQLLTTENKIIYRHVFYYATDFICVNVDGKII